MNISIPIESISDIIAVRLTVLDRDLTNLNPNAVVNNVYIAILEAIHCGMAIFVAGTTKPVALNEPNLVDIPQSGIPTANYKIETTEDDIAGAHTWDEQTEVADNVIFNTDIVDVFAEYLPLAGSVMTGALTLSGNPTLANHAANKTYADLKVSSVAGAGAIESSEGTTPEITIKDATTAVKGAVQLEDSVISESIVKAATPNSVKTAYDKAAGVVSGHSDITSVGAEIEAAVTHKDGDGSDHADVATNTAARHAQNTDTVLDSGGLNEVSAAQAKVAHTHSQDGDIHLSSVQKTDLTDGNVSAAHYHDTDRARANHTGIQAMATISDAGNLAIKDSVDLSGAEVTNKTADNIAESASRKWAGESGADITANHAPQAHRESHGYAGSDPIGFDELPEGTIYRKFLATERAAVTLNTAKETNATHTGDVTGAGALTIGADKVKNTHIDWGAGAGQVDADDLPASATKKWAGESGADITANHAPQAHIASHHSGGSDPIVFDSLAEGTTYKKFLATERATLALIADVKNNLTSTDTDKPLSALQGKTLKDLFDSITQNIEAWICGTEDQERYFYIDLNMYMTYETTIYYQAGGYFLVEYFFKNDAGFPTGMTAPSVWITADLETAGYDVETISTAQSLLSIPKPDYDYDDLYSDGEANKATIVYHIKYVNALYETAFSQNEVLSSFLPPPSTLTVSETVEELLTGTYSATFASDIGGQLAANAVFGSKVASQLSRIIKTTTDPTFTPDFIGQMCVNTTDSKIWFAYGTGAGEWAYGGTKV